MGRVSARGSAWVRWVVWVLAVCIPLHASAVAMTRALAPAHFHAQPVAGPLSGAALLQQDDSLQRRDPMLDQVRVVLNHHGAAYRHAQGHDHRHDALVERHQHDVNTPDVVYVADDSRDDSRTAAAKDTAGKRAVADLGTPNVGLCATLTAGGATTAYAAPPCAFESHIGGLLERPPR